MYKAKLLANELLHESLQKQGKESFKIFWSSKNGKSENFISTYEKGTIRIEAESPLAGAYAISQMQIAAESGHLIEFLGPSQPRFLLRPIWVGCGPEMISPEGIGVALPRFFTSTQQDKTKSALFCRRIIELGYNAVILGSHDGSQIVLNPNSFAEVAAFCDVLQDHGLKAIIKPNFFSKELPKKIGHCPLSKSYQQAIISGFYALFERIANVDFLFWEGSFLHSDFTQDPSARDATLSELIRAEILFLEKNLPSKVSLIYFIPAPDLLAAKQQAKWMSSLCDYVGKGTIISFPAIAGNCFADHLPPHPFWEELRKSPDISATPLLPLVNVGSISQGEGLWPSPTLDLIEKYYSRLYRHRFAGVVALANVLPKKGGMLDCSLWVASQALWRNQSSIQLAETWFHAHRPEWDFSDNIGVLQSMRQLVIELSFLRSLTCETKRDDYSSEDCRLMTESILARLKELQRRIEKLERRQPFKRKENPSLTDYLSVFARDAQRIILHFLQCFNLSYPYVLGGEELQESFWMQISPGGGLGIRSAAKISFFDEPKSGAVGSRMEAIYQENRFL